MKSQHRNNEIHYADIEHLQIYKPLDGSSIYYIRKSFGSDDLYTIELKSLRNGVRVFPLIKKEDNEITRILPKMITFFKYIERINRFVIDLNFINKDEMINCLSNTFKISEDGRNLIIENDNDLHNSSSCPPRYFDPSKGFNNVWAHYSMRVDYETYTGYNEKFGRCEYCIHNPQDNELL